MKKKKIIKITEEQKRKLKEALFNYGTGSEDTTTEYGHSKITADGYEDDTFGGANPPTGDDISHTMCKQYPWGTAYTSVAFNRVLEATANDGEVAIGDLNNVGQDENNDGVSDEYNHADANYDEFGNFNELPGDVKINLQRLCNALQGGALSPKKKIIALNYIIDKCDFSGIPYSYKREAIKKLAAK